METENKLGNFGDAQPEVKTRKNTDYSASAVKMCNPGTIGANLASMDMLHNRLIEVQAEINGYIPAELTCEEDSIQKEITRLTGVIKDLVDLEGSYQDLSEGWYAVKQRKVSKSYNVDIFEQKYPQFAPAIIIKAIDTAKLTGLIKGGLINAEDLKKESPGGYPAVITEKESFVYIIKV